MPDKLSKDERLCVACAETPLPKDGPERCAACEEVRVAAPTLRQIGEVANTVGLSLRTVRYYEEAKLVLPVARTPGGFRLYGDDAIERLRLIMQMKPLGFTLEEMRLLIDARTRLAEGSLDPETETELRERVAMFAAAASTKVDELREQLEVAERFAATLGAEVG